MFINADAKSTQAAYLPVLASLIEIISMMHDAWQAVNYFSDAEGQK